MSRLNINDLHFNVEMQGSGEPLILLHGFMGSTRTWDRHLPAFSNHAQVIAVDLLGHGLSDVPPTPARYQMERCTIDLAAIFDHFGLNSVHLLGYSMGGRVALSFAAAYPDRVRSLVLESSSPGIAHPAERASRVARDEAQAEQLERDGLAAFVDYWEKLPLFTSQASLPDAIRANLRSHRMQNSVIGLANSLRGLGTGVQPSLWDRLAGLDMPSLLIVGALDAKYLEIGQAMTGRLPKARLAIVPEAGHTVHLEQPDRFDRLVLDHLAQFSANSANYRPQAEMG